MAFAITTPEGARGGLPFTEESQLRGLQYWISKPTPIPPPYGHGLAFADLDDDGDPDLILTGADTHRIGIYENVAGQFIDHTDTSGIPMMLGASGVVAFDYDGDADLDLFITQWNYANALLRNDGGFTFTDVASIMQLDAIGTGTGPTVADYDGDGWLDLFVSNYGQENHLYRNVGGQYFEDVSASAGIFGIYNTLQSAFFDMDMDGDKDLYISNDQRSPYNVSEHNRLYQNVNGAFIDISATCGADVGLNSMNVGLADLDNNGYLDIYCTNWSIPEYGFNYPSYLLMNSGGGTFVQQQQAAGVESFRFGWGAVFVDFDNNKTIDLYVCTQSLANRLYVNKGQWPLVDEAGAHGVNLTGDTRCVAAADIDNDGDLDMAVQEFGGNTRLFINHEGELRNWLRIAPVGLLPNRQSAGATIRMRTGDLWQLHELVAGSNYKTQNELIAHFGLDSDPAADEVVVRWYDGATRTLTMLTANRTHRVYHPDLLGDLDEDGAISNFEIAAFIHALLHGDFPEPERFDFSGDGKLDSSDIQGMADRLTGGF